MKQTKTMNRWFVVAGSLIIGLLGGLMYAWSIFVKPVCSTYGWGTEQVALMGNVMMAFFTIGTSIGGNVLKKLGSVKTSLAGSVLFGLGVLASAFVSSPVAMYFTWGVCGGLGIGFLYSIGMYVASAWFPDKRGFIMGLFLTAFGLSLTVFSGPISILLESIGVQRTMGFMGCTFLVILGSVSVFLMKLPPDGWQAPQRIQVVVSRKEESLVSCTVREAVRTPAFWLFASSFFFLVIPYSFINSFTTVYATDYRGLTSGQAVSIVSLMGVGAAAGRLAGGYIVDRLGKRFTLAVFSLCSVLACLLLLFSRSYVGIALAFTLISTGYGGRTPVYGVWPIEQFGPENASAIYGMSVLACIPAMLLGPLLTTSTSYSVATTAALAASLIGLAGFLITPKQTPVMKKNRSHL